MDMGDKNISIKLICKITRLESLIIHTFSRLVKKYFTHTYEVVLIVIVEISRRVHWRVGINTVMG